MHLFFKPATTLTIGHRNAHEVRAMLKMSNMALISTVGFLIFEIRFTKWLRCTTETANNTCLTNHSFCSVRTMAGITPSEAEQLRSILLRHTNQQQATVCAVHASCAFLRLIR